jgi:hypothetical protein
MVCLERGLLGPKTLSYLACMTGCSCVRCTKALRKAIRCTRLRHRSSQVYCASTCDMMGNGIVCIESANSAGFLADAGNIADTALAPLHIAVGSSGEMLAGNNPRSLHP